MLNTHKADKSQDKKIVLISRKDTGPQNYFFILQYFAAKRLFLLVQIL